MFPGKTFRPFNKVSCKYGGIFDVSKMTHLRRDNGNADCRDASVGAGRYKINVDSVVTL